MMDDAELLRCYAGERSEAAFTEFVGRHIDLVYAAASRRTGGDPHRAGEVAQHVFIAAARHAAALARHASVSGWLYTATRNAALNLMRDEQRRRRREQVMQAAGESLAATEAETDWSRLKPVLDAAMDELNPRDREAVLLRYFEGRALVEVGARLQVTENAARMRVERALEKLHALLVRRGVTSTATALGIALSQQAALAAPAGMAASVAGAAMLGAGAASATVGIFSFMSTSHFTSAVAALAAFAAVGTAIHNAREARTAEDALAAATADTIAATAQLRQLERRSGPGSSPTATAANAPATVTRMTVPSRLDTPERAKAAEEFLAANPTAGRLLEIYQRQSLDLRYGQQLRALGYSASDYERIGGVLARDYAMTLGVGDMTFKLGPEGAGPFDQGGGRLQEVLGAENFRRFGELLAKEKLLAVVGALAGTASLSGMPLLPTQAHALADAIERQSPVTMRIEGYEELRPNWKAIRQQAEAILSPLQLVLFNAAIESDAPVAVLKPVPRP